MNRRSCASGAGSASRERGRILQPARGGAGGRPRFWGRGEVGHTAARRIPVDVDTQSFVGAAHRLVLWSAECGDLAQDSPREFRCRRPADRLRLRNFLDRTCRRETKRCPRAIWHRCHGLAASRRKPLESTYQEIIAPSYFRIGGCRDHYFGGRPTIYSQSGHFGFAHRSQTFCCGQCVVASTRDRSESKCGAAGWGIPEDAPVVLFCAKLQPWKRPDDVLRAFAKANVEGAYLILAGDGPLRGNLEAAAKSLGVAERTRFLGFVNQTGLPSVYRSADLFVLPSKYDACPVVVCEAMLCGCPVVLSDEIRGRFDLVNERRTGFIYPCGNIDVLAGILGSVLRDGTKLAELGRAAILRMETWSPRENVDALVLAAERARSQRL